MVGDEFVGGKRAGEGDVMQIACCPGGCLNVKHIKVTDMLFFRAATGPGCSFGARSLVGVRTCVAPPGVERGRRGE